MTPHEEIQADLSLYVLGSLTSEEVEAVERHLAEGCDECLAEVARWREVVGLLPFGVSTEALPVLRRELLERIAAAGEPVAAVRSAPGPRGVRARTRAAVGRRRWLPVALAAAATMALAYGIARDAGLRSQLQAQRRLAADLRSALAQAQTDLAQGEAALRRVRDELAAREHDLTSLRTAVAAAEDALSVLRRPGLNLVRLKQTADAKPAEGHVLISAATGKALFYAFDLAPLPRGSVYELWWITEKEGPVSAGLFEPDPSGVGRVETGLPSGAGAIKAAAVTVEPSGGVPKPTGPMVLLGNI
jgi:anti-sigma-K factor RskA